MLFFGRLPDLTNPVIARAIDAADYFCAQTYHYQQKKVEDNETAKLTTGPMRRMFTRLGQLSAEGDRIVAEANALAAGSAATAEGTSSEVVSVKKPVKKGSKKVEAEPMDLDSDVFDNGAEEETPSNEPKGFKTAQPKVRPVKEDPLAAPGRRAAARKAEMAIKQDIELEEKEEEAEKNKPILMDIDEDVEINDPVPMVVDDGQAEEEDDDDDGAEYEVEEVLDDRVQDGRRQYFIKWQGYDASFNTWEDEDHCENCPEILKAYITRRYHDFPDKFLSMMKSFKSAAPAGSSSRAAGAAGLNGLPADVRFYHDLKSNMIVLLGAGGTAAAASINTSHKWVVANSRREQDPDRKRGKVPPAPPDAPAEGLDMLGVWGNGVAPPWVRKISSFRSHEASTVKAELVEMRRQDSRSVLGCWSRDNTYRFGGKQWLTIFGWAILERATGAVEALLQLVPAIHLDPCAGDVSESNGITRVDGMFLAAWNGRKDMVAALLKHGASPFTVSMWSGFDVCIPLEISLVFYYMNLGGLINEFGVRADTPKAVLTALKESLQAGVPFMRNQLYLPRVKEDDKSPHAQIVLLFQDWMRSQPDVVA